MVVAPDGYRSVRLMAMLETRSTTETRPARPQQRTAAAPPPVRREQERMRQLRQMKRRATAMIVVMTGIFLVMTITGADGGWLAYVQAAEKTPPQGGVAASCV